MAVGIIRNLPPNFYRRNDNYFASAFNKSILTAAARTTTTTTIATVIPCNIIPKPMIPMSVPFRFRTVKMIKRAKLLRKMELFNFYLRTTTTTRMQQQQQQPQPRALRGTRKTLRMTNSLPWQRHSNHKTNHHNHSCEARGPTKKRNPKNPPCLRPCHRRGRSLVPTAPHKAAWRSVRDNTSNNARLPRPWELETRTTTLPLPRLYSTRRHKP